MAGQKFTLTFDANLNVSQMKSSLNQIQNTLNGLHLPQNIASGLQGTFNKLQKELQEFEVAVGKDITSKSDFNKLESQAIKLNDAFEKLKIYKEHLIKYQKRFKILKQLLIKILPVNLILIRQLILLIKLMMLLKN